MTNGGEIESMAGNAEARLPDAGAVPAASTEELYKLCDPHRLALAAIRVGNRERKARWLSVSGRWEDPLD